MKISLGNHILIRMPQYLNPPTQTTKFFQTLVILNSYYTAPIPQVLLPAANILQLNEVRDACCEFLQSQLHPSNCLGIRAFADLHACADLLQYAQNYTEQHFCEVVAGAIKDFDVLNEYLSSAVVKCKSFSKG